MVKWEGYSSKDNTWEPVSTFADGLHHFIDEFKESKGSAKAKKPPAAPKAQSIEIDSVSDDQMGGGSKVQKPSKIRSEMKEPLIKNPVKMEKKEMGNVTVRKQKSTESDDEEHIEMKEVAKKTAKTVKKQESSETDDGEKHVEIKEVARNASKTVKNQKSAETDDDKKHVEIKEMAKKSSKTVNKQKSVETDDEKDHIVTKEMAKNAPGAVKKQKSTEMDDEKGQDIWPIGRMRVLPEVIKIPKSNEEPSKMESPFVFESDSEESEEEAEDEDDEVESIHSDDSMDETAEYEDAEEIYGGAMHGETLMLQVKFKDNVKPQWMPANKAKALFPQMVIEFYEQKINWGQNQNSDVSH